MRKKILIICSIISFSSIFFQNELSKFINYLRLYNCSYKDELIKDFISHAMIRNYCLYTLYGYKPITAINIQYGPVSEKKRKQAYEKLPKEKQNQLPYDKFVFPECSGRTQWSYLKEELKTKNLEEHFFIEYSFEHGKEFDSVLFVHKPSLINILQQNYADFKRELSLEFDPLKKVEELERGCFEFWDKIFKEKHHYLMGIVFGFGDENARKFQLELDNKAVAKRVKHVPDSEIRKLFKDKVTVQDLGIPQFISYDKDDKVVANYREKRKLIVSRLKEKNLKKEVFSLLEKMNKD